MRLIARQPLGDGLAERLRPIADGLGSYVAEQLRASGPYRTGPPGHRYGALTLCPSSSLGPA
jgi:hypothetical protein